MIGCVTQVIRSRACGFIRAENGQHVFFHARDLHHTTFDELEVHQSVQFSFVPDAISGPRAVHVEVDHRRLRPAGPKR
jgi:cold shock CspA family protein